MTPLLPGALVLSLDFELAWGLRDQGSVTEDFSERLHGARRAVPRLLELFEEFEVAATWAVVGFLFASTREELLSFSPEVRPAYRDPRLSPYAEPLGEAEEDDPLHFAGSLVRAIQRAPRQEIATHTFSHFYCTEPGQDRESFRADLAAARAIASSHGVALRSIVFPRNQHKPEYDDVLLDMGIRCYRGNPPAKSWEFGDFEESARSGKRLARLYDAYLGGGRWNITPWSDVRRASGLSDVRASTMLRPYTPALRGFESARLGRIRRGLRVAAREGRMLHLWWHPHNFGVHPEENFAFLRRVLVEFAELRDRHGMRSLSMAGADGFVNWEGQRGAPRRPAAAGRTGADFAGVRP